MNFQYGTGLNDLTRGHHANKRPFTLSMHVAFKGINYLESIIYSADVSMEG